MRPSKARYIFLSTLSLRRATLPPDPLALAILKFLSTLSLRRATADQQAGLHYQHISIHALLAESDAGRCGRKEQGPGISIHALLAESDGTGWGVEPRGANFYPRSPCGERQLPGPLLPFAQGISIHALLAESDRRRPVAGQTAGHFYPRSPCGERRAHSTTSTPT